MALAREDAVAFVDRWIADWNSHELDRVLSHWSEDAVFSSPMIPVIMGGEETVVRGKAALRAYWERALESVPDLHFELQEVFVGSNSVVIGYLNQRGQGCAEAIGFGEAGLAVWGEAHYAPPPSQ
jgi:ketosteroid isomerase-like protein